MLPYWRWATSSRRRRSCQVTSPTPGARRRPPRWSPDQPVVVLGTGLTMVDVCLSLVEQGFDRTDPCDLAAWPAAARPRAFDPLARSAAARSRSALVAHALPRGPARGAPSRRAGGRLARGDRRRSAACADPLGRAGAGRQGAVRAPCPALVGHPPPSDGAAGGSYHRDATRLRHAADPCRADQLDRCGGRRAAACAGAPRARPSSSSCWPSA